MHGYCRWDSNYDMLVVAEAAQLNGDWETRDGHKALDITIPILMRNKVPDGFETDDKLDVSLRPESVCKDQIKLYKL